MSSGDDRLNARRPPAPVAALLAGAAFWSAGLAPVAAAPSTDAPFTITSAVTALPACTAPAVLYPGLDRCLRYTVDNPSPFPITVTAIGIADVTAPAGCDRSNLDLSRTEFTGTLTVPAGGRAAAPPRRIMLIETGVNQDACQGATFTFTYRGVATANPGTVPQPEPQPQPTPPGPTPGPGSGAGPGVDIPRTGGDGRLVLGLGAGALVAGALAVAASRRAGRRRGVTSR